jgi:hypothetical protein
MSKPQDDVPMASRSGTSNHFGKCTEELKTLLPFEIKEGFARIAHEHGMSPSEYLREIVMLNVLGVDGVRKIYEDRIARIAGIGCGAGRK